MALLLSVCSRQRAMDLIYPRSNMCHTHFPAASRQKWIQKGRGAPPLPSYCQISIGGKGRCGARRARRAGNTSGFPPRLSDVRVRRQSTRPQATKPKFSVLSRLENIFGVCRTCSPSGGAPPLPLLNGRFKFPAYPPRPLREPSPSPPAPCPGRWESAGRPS